LRDGTVLVVDDQRQSPFKYDYEIWAALNLVYRYEQRSTDLGGVYLEDDLIETIRHEDQTTRTLRGITVGRDYSNALVAYHSRTGCARLIDGKRLELPEQPSSRLLAVAARSRLDRIVVDAAPAGGVARIFGPEPAHGWCYYFQAAELARQREDHAGVLQLLAAVQEGAMKPEDPTEWYPFIESLLILDKDEAAAAILEESENPPALRARVCHLVDRWNKPELRGLRCWDADWVRDRTEQ
jgi:hypothetical protein